MNRAPFATVATLDPMYLTWVMVVIVVIAMVLAVVFVYSSVRGVRDLQRQQREVAKGFDVIPPPPVASSAPVPADEPPKT
jgi:hypothetical protein